MSRESSIKLSLPKHSSPQQAAGPRWDVDVQADRFVFAAARSAGDQFSGRATGDRHIAWYILCLMDSAIDRTRSEGATTIVRLDQGDLQILGAAVLQRAAERSKGYRVEHPAKIPEVPGDDPLILARLLDCVMVATEFYDGDKSAETAFGEFNDARIEPVADPELALSQAITRSGRLALSPVISGQV